MVTSILPLRLDGVTVRKRGKRLIGPITETIDGTGLTIVLGSNGSGKTTLLRLMHGLERPADGGVHWQVGQREARRRQAFVFQTPIIMRRSVADNIAYPLLVQGVKRDRARAEATDWAATIGLADALDRDGPVLSGGEKQKLAIARALIIKPDILFLDEPTTNLDGLATREIEAMLISALGTGARIVMTTHDIGQARRLASEVIYLYRGQVHERAAAETFFGAPKTREAHLFLKGDIVE